MLEHVTLAELQDMLQTLRLPPETRLTVQFEDTPTTQQAIRRQKALEAMQKIKGSGNGQLVAALLAEREKDARL
jgi:hypothetical protein